MVDLVLILMGALVGLLSVIVGKTSDIKFNIKDPTYFWSVGFVGGGITATLITLGAGIFNQITP